MKREIKFRGLTTSGVWVYGLLAKRGEDFFISNSKDRPFAFQVRPETISQYIRKHDSEGVELYEDDLVMIDNSSTYDVSMIGWIKKVVHIKDISDYYKYLGGLNWALESVGKGNIKKVGNIYENPELLK